jgi:hypothetical protein
MNYKKYIISKGEKVLGLLFEDIQEYILTPNEYKEFKEFMRGQTVGCLGGNDVVYVGDFERFIKALPVID